MAVTIPELTRNVKSGIQGNPKTQPIPTGPSQTARVAPDPGVAGGPSNVPLRAFGTGGSDVLGAALQNISADVITEQRALETQALKTRLQAEEVEIGLILTETSKQFDALSADAGKTTAPFNEQGLSPFDIYRKKSQEVVDKQIKILDEKNFSPGSKEKLANQLQSSITVHNAAVAKSVHELKAAEYNQFVVRSYKSSAERHPGDLTGTLAENGDIFRDTRLLLGDTASLTLLQQNNEAAALTMYDEHFNEGRFTKAQAALDGNIAKLYISPETRRVKIAEVRKARTAAFIKDEVDSQVDEKVKEGIIDGGDGHQYQLKRNEDGDIVATKIPGLPGKAQDLTKNLVETANGGRVQIFVDTDGTKKAKPVPGFPIVDDFSKDTLKLKDGSSVQLFRDPETKKITSKPIEGTTSVPEMVANFNGMVDAIKEQTGIPLDVKTKTDLGNAIAGLPPKDIPVVQAKIDAAKLLIEDGTIKFKTVEEQSEFFKSLLPKDALTGAAKGIAEAEEQVAKQKKLKELGFREVFEVDESSTNSITGLVEAGLGSISQGGVLTKVKGAEKLIPTIVAMAEDNLVSGKARTIGRAVQLAFKQFVDGGGELPEIVTGASIVASLKAAAQKPSLKQQAERQEKRLEVIEKYKSNALTKADLEETLARLDAIDFTFMKKEAPLDFENAMGFRSSLVSLIGKTVAQIPGLGHLENAEVTKARLMFSLIARDIVRMISLSPRFAVKEQELIQSIFSGPQWWNSPEQAQNKVETMLGIIDDRMSRIEERLSLSNIDPARESDLVDEADRLLEIQGRMNKFEFNIIRVKTVAQANRLSAKQAHAHMQTLSPADIKALDGKVAIALNNRIKGKGGKSRRKSKK